MSLSPELGKAIVSGLPAALALSKIVLDNDNLEELVDAVSSTVRKARRIAKARPIDAAVLESLCDGLSKEISPLLPDDDEVCDRVQEIAELAIEAATSKEPKRGLPALLARISDWLEPDPGNLEARAKRARQSAEELEREATRLDQIAARKRAKG